MSWSLRSVWTPPLSPTPHTGGLVWTPWPRSRGLPRKTPDTLLISTRKLGHTRQETSLPLAMSLCLCSSFGQATMPKGLAAALWTITSMQPGQQRIDLTPTGGQKTAAVQRVHCPVAVRERRREGGVGSDSRGAVVCGAGRVSRSTFQLGGHSCRQGVGSGMASGAGGGLGILIAYISECNIVVPHLGKDNLTRRGSFQEKFIQKDAFRNIFS